MSEQLGIGYLQEATDSKAKKIVGVASGFYYGDNDRTIVPFVVCYQGLALWVPFLVDSGCPRTYLSPHASAALKLESGTQWWIMIGGHATRTWIAPTGPRFTDLNILGSDFCKKHNVVKGEDYLRGMVKNRITLIKMFRFPSRLAFQDLSKPLLRFIHHTPAPDISSPTYNSVLKRLNSVADQQMFHKRQPPQEVKSDAFDALFPDIKHETLDTIISEEIGIPYLSSAAEAEAKKVIRVAQGYIHGRHCRTIFPLAVTHKDEARWVFFIVGSLCPLTYLSHQTSKVLGIQPDTVRSVVSIGGHLSPAYKASIRSHICGINLLGTDFFTLHGVSAIDIYSKRRAILYFGGNQPMAQVSKAS
ncbi:hypothetical protein B9Z19DRAFT_1128505 [Tuber borchii]|uniref:Uncharacterized protein n=1 Tax=Tuber borchii TaxID=42251 RepID=A0A2T6ZP90_TUBBO|nr:hypothetical protein B9Z19DRAFT_1128505 [Tuber borchii]